MAILVACGTRSPQTVPILASNIVGTPTFLKATSTPQGNQTIVNSTSTMEPTFAYWATAQEARFNADDTQVVETKQAISTLTMRYSQMCGAQLEGVFKSPDGNWIASDCRFDAGSFRVFHIQDNHVWEIPYSEIFEYYPDFLGSVSVLHWSDDGNFLYLVNRSCCPHTDTMSTGDALYRLNLQTGDWRLIVPGYFNYYSFSPSERRLVYILNNQANANDAVYLHVVDLSTGREEIVNAGNFEQAGQAVWREDGLQLALIAQIGNIYDDNRKYSLLVLDVLQRTQKTIILDSSEALSIINWSNDDILAINKVKKLENAGYYVSQIDTLYYDLKTSQFINSTSVP